MHTGASRGFTFSALLHGSVIALVLLFTYALHLQAPEAPKIFELVQGEGDNYTATKAPKLGVPGGQKISVHEAVSPPAAHTPPAPVVERAPVPATAKSTSGDIPNFAKEAMRVARSRERRIMRQFERQRAAEERREKAAEARRLKEEALNKQRMTKAEFDAQNRREAAAAKSGVHPKHIDAAGIVKGVLEGSEENTIGGANGKALTRDESNAVDDYISYLVSKVKEALDENPGVGAGLVVEVEFRITPSGSITGFRISRSSGSADFDRAVREAFAYLNLPPRPKGMPELQRFPIRGVE